MNKQKTDTNWFMILQNLCKENGKNKIISEIHRNKLNLSKNLKCLRKEIVS